MRSADLIERARAGLEGLPVAVSVREAAVAHLSAFVADPAHADALPLLAAWVDVGRFDQLLDAFYRVIPFGTGGRRGAVGVGPNRINPTTVALAVQGHVAFLRERFPGVDLQVAIAYDVRRFADLRRVTPPGVAHPLHGLTSRDLAELAARVYAANGVVAWIQRRGDPRYLATPQLSFAVRHLGAHAGLVISASHNPPDDNGVKFYDHHGGQEVPPHDEAMVAAVERVDGARVLSWDDAVATGRVCWLDDAVHRAYVDVVVGCSLVPAARSARVVFTGLHGAGTGSVAESLEAAGFDVHRVADQCVADGAFPTVPFRAPNPEVPAALERAIAVARERGADLVLATDPDADRIGAAVRDGAGWRVLTGNEIASLIVDHGLTHGRKAVTPLVVQTEVTTGFLGRLARAHDARVVDHLLVGFKYIGDLLLQLETTGRFGDLEAPLEAFLVGCEESHGVLVTPHIRDKDAAGGALWLAEAASLHPEGLYAHLRSLWAAHGLVVNRLRSAVLQGAAGKARIDAMLDHLRRQAPAAVGGLPVTAAHDRLDERGVHGPILSGTDRAARNVIVLECGDRARFVLRPSGTEPKVKLYVEVRASPGEGDVAALEAEADALGAALIDALLTTVGLAMPAWGHAVDDLVPIEHKRAFALEILPEWIRRLAAGEPVAPWLDEALALLGDGARRLVAPAVAARVAVGDLDPTVAAALSA